MLHHALIQTHQRRQANNRGTYPRKNHFAKSPSLGPGFAHLQASKKGETHKHQDTHSSFNPCTRLGTLVYTAPPHYRHTH